MERVAGNDGHLTRALAGIMHEGRRAYRKPLIRLAEKLAIAAESRVPGGVGAEIC